MQTMLYGKFYKVQLFPEESEVFHLTRMETRGRLLQIWYEPLDSSKCGESLY